MVYKQEWVPGAHADPPSSPFLIAGRIEKDRLEVGCLGCLLVLFKESSYHERLRNETGKERTKGVQTEILGWPTTLA